MTHSAVDSVVRRARQESGDALRTAVHHHEAGFDIAYARDEGPDPKSLQTDERRLNEWWETAMVPNIGEGRGDRGSLKAVVELFEEAVLVHVRFPASERRAVTLVFDPNVAPRLDEFVADCIKWYECCS